MPAPQANLVAMIAKGVIEQNLPLGLVGVGVAFALILALLKVPVIPFAIGLYLPLSLSAATFLGGLARKLADLTSRSIGGGTLFASGLIGGDALLGVLIAIFAVLGWIPISAPNILPDFFSLIFFVLLASVMYMIARK